MDRRIPCRRYRRSEMRFPASKSISHPFIFCFIFICEVTDSVTGLSDRNSVARAINNGADRDGSPLEPFYGVDGQLIPHFPATLGDTKRLSGKCLNLLGEGFG